MSRHIATVGCCLLGLLAAAGCQSNAAQQLLERELRLQEDRIYQLEDIIEQQCRLLEDCQRQCAACDSSASPTYGVKSGRTFRTKRDPVPDEPKVRTLVPTPPTMDLELGPSDEVKVSPPMPPALPYLEPERQTPGTAPLREVPGPAPLVPDSASRPSAKEPAAATDAISIMAGTAQPLRRADPAVAPAEYETPLPGAIAGPAASTVPQSSLRLLPAPAGLSSDPAADDASLPAEPVVTEPESEQPRPDAAKSPPARSAAAPPPRRAPKPLWRPYR